MRRHGRIYYENTLLGWEHFIRLRTLYWDNILLGEHEGLTIQSVLPLRSVFRLMAHCDFWLFIYYECYHKTKSLSENDSLYYKKNLYSITILLLYNDFVIWRENKDTICQSKCSFSPLRSVMEIFYLWGLFNDWQILEKEGKAWEYLLWEHFIRITIY